MRMRSIPNSFKALCLAALGVFSGAIGCASDDYYCDASGCFYCDGVGCRVATPPTRPACRGDFECATNQTCTSFGCVTGCANTSANCPRGWACRVTPAAPAGQCLAPTEPVPTPTPGSCRSNADCPTGVSCVNGMCARTTCNPATSSCPCTDATQCASGQSCVAGRCTATTDTCRFSSQCGAGRVCVNQQCRAACSATAPCPAGQMCNTDGVCVDRVANECVRDADCGAGRRCVNATCLTACSTNAECGAGRYCADGVCLADTRRQPFCTTDAQCTSPSRCLDGLCRRPCATADECLRTDVQYRNCAPIRYLNTAQSFCQTNNEVQSNCARAADCAAGQACVDGVCRTN
jgi:hypothetical protein